MIFLFPRLGYVSSLEGMQLLFQNFWEIIIAALRSPIAVNQPTPPLTETCFWLFALPKSELPRTNLAIKILGSSDVSVLQDLEAMHSHTQHPEEK